MNSSYNCDIDIHTDRHIMVAAEVPMYAKLYHL